MKILTFLFLMSCTDYEVLSIRYMPILLFERRTQESNLQAGITGRLLSGQLLHH